MHAGQRVVVVMPAYNAARTLRRTYDEVMAQDVVDRVIVVDDGSRDDTVALARALPNAVVHVHDRNRGYGANQKTCYRLALEAGADVIVMVHPDYQYTPRLLPAMVALVTSGLYGVVLASRILGGRAVADGMPRWKYVGNRVLTAWQNLCTGAKLSEYHTGYRAFHREVLTQIDVARCPDDFVFDCEALLQILWRGWRIGEVTCPTRYDEEASSVGFAGSVQYGVGCVTRSAAYWLARRGLGASRRFPAAVRGTAVHAADRTGPADRG